MAAINAKRRFQMELFPTCRERLLSELWHPKTQIKEDNMSQHKRNSAFTSQLPDYERDVLNFGAKARRIRETRGLSLDNLANLTGIDKAALSRIENGTRIPKYDTFLRIVDALDAPLADFMPSRFFEDDGTWFRVRALFMRLPEQERAEAERHILAMLIGLCAAR